MGLPNLEKARPLKIRPEDLPDEVRVMLGKSSPLVKALLIDTLNSQGVQYVLDRKGLLESQAEYIDSL